MATTAAILDFGQEHAIFDLQVTAMLPTRFKSVGILVQEKKQILDFQDGHLGGFKFQVNGPFSSGEEVKNIFSRWQLQWPSCISNWNSFSYF